jgi:hypothetical protein
MYRRWKIFDLQVQCQIKIKLKTAVVLVLGMVYSNRNLNSQQ